MSGIKYLNYVSDIFGVPAENRVERIEIPASDTGRLSSTAFVVPLCATIHLSGSMITLTSCIMGVLLLNGMPHSLGMMFPFLCMLGIAMVAAPGAPGGAVMSALPFLFLIGIDAQGPLGSLLIALYITQDSFGTAINVSGDNAIAIYVDEFYKKYIKKAA